MKRTREKEIPRVCQENKSASEERRIKTGSKEDPFNICTSSLTAARMHLGSNLLKFSLPLKENSHIKIE